LDFAAVEVPVQAEQALHCLIKKIPPSLLCPQVAVEMLPSGRQLGAAVAVVDGGVAAAVVVAGGVAAAAPANPSMFHNLKGSVTEVVAVAVVAAAVAE